MDKLMLFGQGADESNADGRRMAWGISGSTRAKWKQASRGGGFPSFLIEDGACNDYPYIASNQFSATHQAVFGNWEDLLVLIWGSGIEFIVDKFTAAASGDVKITACIWWNQCLRHPQSFACITDAGNQ